MSVPSFDLQLLVFAVQGLKDFGNRLFGYSLDDCIASFSGLDPIGWVITSVDLIPSPTLA